ncbi:MAG: hypothetical protein CL793_06610 [Chloroflexi bacterium]|nr:hypothetical protein [Chloroflexota bacterium]|tara:strand:+ start:460 stop:1161 length:702 start_codon:yes stop_codon:yes gene_type:complete
MAKANPFDINTAHRYKPSKRSSGGSSWRVGKQGSTGRRGKITFTPGFQAHGWLGAGNPFGGKSGKYLGDAKREQELGYKAIKRGEDRMGQDQTLALVDKYIKQMLPEVAGQMPALNEEQKGLLNKQVERAWDQRYKSNMANLANVAGSAGIGATGQLAKSTLAHGKEKYGHERAAALDAARAGIAGNMIRNAQQAMAAAGNLGLGVASGRAAAAQPFTLQESRERFGQSFPNV